MLSEKILTKLKLKDNKIIEAKLHLYDTDPKNYQNVMLELYAEGLAFSSSDTNYFEALIRLREILEKDNIQILCKGANKNVHQSGMQGSMGVGRIAYALEMNKKTKLTDIVDIFELSNCKECVSINEQKNFFKSWFESWR